MKKNEIFWIGIQESEIVDTNGLFSGSITVFGSGNNNNYAFDKEYNWRYNYNLDNELWFEFADKAALDIVHRFPDCKFILYYPMEATNYCREITSRLICINDPIMLDVWDNKLRCREWLGNDVPVICSEILCGDDILDDYYPDKEVVIQSEYSCGGFGTWLLTEKDRFSIRKKISRAQNYIISPYIEKNVSVNVHLLIYSNEVIILPPSVQLINTDNGAFEYCGGDFITYRFIPQTIQNKIKNYSKIIGERLQRSGFLGVCGIDFITTEEEVYFSEINPRFQSSTFVINRALHKLGYEFSIQELHIDAFNHKICSWSIDTMPINFSYYKISYKDNHKDKIKELSERANRFNEIVYIDDELSWNMRFDNDTYLYKLLFERNICSISPEYTLIIHPNLRIFNSIINPNDCFEQILELKIMLLSHGIYISYETQKLLDSKSGINYEEFDAIDLIINNKYYVSVPYLTNLSEISPFQIKETEENLYLYFNTTKLFSIAVRGIDTLAQKLTKNGLKYSDVSYLGQDRLRINQRLGCIFKQNNCGCEFCDIENDNRILTYEDITEVVDAYENSPDLRHYLIGGGSQSLNDNFVEVSRIARYIQNKNNKPIYLMSLPIDDETILMQLKESGITEVSYNIEVFDRTIAQKYMPGKGLIPLQKYYSALRKSVKIWGNCGNVRSILIVGLESKQSLLNGVEQLCQIGVSPILSLLKPIANTPSKYLLPPSDEEILDIVVSTEKICNKYNLPLGPSCRLCEDNTLKITR